VNKLKKRSIRISGHDTSITLEDEFWQALCDIGKAQSKSINQLVCEIDKTREGNLSSALRLYVLADLKEKVKTNAGMA